MSYMEGGIFVDFEKARHFEGKMVRFRTKKGDWRIGKVVKATKDGVQIKELIANADEGYAYPWGPGPWGPGPAFAGAALFDLAVIDLAVLPWFFW
jgi:hypothetical protein